MASLTAQDTYTPAKLLQPGDFYSVSISGTFAGTITIQRSKDLVTWMDMRSETGPKELDGQTGAAWYYRAGFKAGAYTSGTAMVDLM